MSQQRLTLVSHMAGIGAPRQYDWEGLYAEFIKINNGKDEITLKAWTDSKGLPYTNTSRQFAKIERELENYRLRRVKRRLMHLSEKSVDTLDKLFDSTDEKILQTNAFGVLDRTGHAPQAATHYVTNIQAENAQVIIPPLFASAYLPDAERMLGGKLDAGNFAADSGTGEGAQGEGPDKVGD